MGPFVYDRQGFQVTFTTTRAGAYTISTARNGVPAWQVNSTTNSVIALSEPLHVPSCVVEVGAGFVRGRVAAGTVGKILVYGRDSYGALSRVPGSLFVGAKHCKPLCITALHATGLAPPVGLSCRAHGASLSATVHAGNNVTVNYTPQIDAIIPPMPLMRNTFSSFITWQPSPPAAVIHINATAALALLLPLSANGHPLPGTPLPLAITAGPVDTLQSGITGSGASAGEPGEWNPVRLVPRDAFRNVLEVGVLTVESLTLELTPPANSLRPFVVRSLLWPPSLYGLERPLSVLVLFGYLVMRFLLLLGHAACTHRNTPMSSLISFAFLWSQLSLHDGHFCRCRAVTFCGCSTRPGSGRCLSAAPSHAAPFVAMNLNPFLAHRASLLCMW